MVTLTRRKWYLAALTLATGAIAMQLVGKHYAGLGTTTMADAVQAFNISKQFAEEGKDAVAVLKRTGRDG